MFKRANKITSLLVAAAAVVSLVPASAADVKKIDSEDGTVYNAVAYADGKAYVDGDVNDDEAAYYVDGEFTALEDIDSGDDATLYGEKYLNVSDGDYTVDLDAGTVTDDNIVEDTEDDTASSLRKEIKDDTDDRYQDDKAIVGNTQETKEVGTGIYDLKEVPGAKYGANWYYTEYANVDVDANGGIVTSPTLNVFADSEGNYIDADYNLGKIKVTTTGGSVDDSVNVENTNDSYDFGAGSLTATISQTDVIAQDADYIYRTAQVTLTSTVDDITAIAGVDFTPTNSLQLNVVQKISKEAASDDIDGANYAKTVTTYVVSNDDGTALDGASDVLVRANVRYTVAGGKLIAYSTDDTAENVLVRAYTLKSSSGYYYMDEESDSKEDAEVSSDVEEDAFDNCAVDTDKDGNLYRLDGGYIYQFDNTDDWNKLYKVDGSFNELSVYDEDNMVVWSEGDEVYSLIGGKTTTDEETPEETPVVTAGWAQAANGTWTYNKADGTKATGWLLDGATWYYLKADGVMATGWVLDGATWYYTNASGAMATGWVNDNGTWYYCNASGAMLANTTVDGYVLGASGAWVK